MRARHYDPVTGQFLQRDPMQYEDSGNLYAAFRWNPMTQRDPTGLGIGQSLGNIFGSFRNNIAKKLDSTLLFDKGHLGEIARVFMPKRHQNAYAQYRAQRDLIDAQQAAANSAANAARLAAMPSTSKLANTLDEFAERTEIISGAIDPAIGRLAKSEWAVETRLRAFGNEIRLDALGSAETGLSKFSSGLKSEKTLVDGFKNRSPSPGTFDIGIHGDVDGKLYIKVSEIAGPCQFSELRMVDLVEEMLVAGYHGQPIRLLACNAAHVDNGAAAQLSAIFQTRVQAGTGCGWFWNTGEVQNSGKWRFFSGGFFGALYR